MPNMSVRFWGVRGSIPCPGPDTLRYGGNTSCIEVMCGQQQLIFDAGSGIRRLGASCLDRNYRDYQIFFTHTHLDHIIGLPFFAPAFNPAHNIKMYAGHLQGPIRLRDVLSGMMQDPIFPIGIDQLNAQTEFAEFAPGDVLTPAEGISIRTAPLNHPNGATGYRIDYGDHSVCIITDTEHFADGLDQNIVDLVRDSDIMIYDSTYTDEQYPRHKGWGHSTWQEGMRLCTAANVERLVIFHHDPSHDDDKMDAIASAAEAARHGTVVAREGMVLYL